MAISKSYKDVSEVKASLNWQEKRSEVPRYRKKMFVIYRLLHGKCARTVFKVALYSFFGARSMGTNGASARVF